MASTFSASRLEGSRHPSQYQNKRSQKPFWYWNGDPVYPIQPKNPEKKPSSPSSTIIVWIINSLIMVIKPCPESVQTVLSKWPLFPSSAPFSNSYPPQLAGHGQQFYTCSPLNSEQDFTLNYFTPSLSDHCLALSAICCINFTHMTY